MEVVKQEPTYIPGVENDPQPGHYLISSALRSREQNPTNPAR